MWDEAKQKSEFVQNTLNWWKTKKNATQPCLHSIIKIGVKNNGDEIPRGEHIMPLLHDSSLQLKYLVQKCIDGRLQAAPLIIIFPTY